MDNVLNICNSFTAINKQKKTILNLLHFLTVKCSPIYASSCVQVLAEDGEVHVSLCNGQGGTPADQPKREWHNSWQITVMAAEADLILTQVRPFESEKYQSYKCTGYR